MHSYLNNVHPDANFPFYRPISNYMVEESISDQFIPKSPNETFSLMHLNARSLIGNFDKIEILLANLRKSFSVIGVTETWLNDLTSDLVNMPGYSFVSNHRKSKIGGGIGLYLENNLQYKICSECTYSNPDIIESLFVEINVPHGKNIVVGVIYRPPNQNTAVFIDELNDILINIIRGNKLCYIMGDFNLDLLRYNDNVPTQEFIDRLFSYSFYPLISNPTRITSHTATLIDNIFTNQLSDNVFNGIVLNDLSDHLPIFACFYKDFNPHCQQKAFRRSFSEYNINTFRECLSEINCTNRFNGLDTNNSYDIFINEYIKIFDACFPMERIKCRTLQNRNSPWITKGLLKSISKKNRLYKQLINSPNKQRELRYKIYKNKLTHLIRNAKRTYYENRFEIAKNDMKLTWRLVNEVINKRKTKQSLPSAFMSEGKMITDHFEIANRFCKYFTDIDPALASRIPSTSFSFRSFLTDNENCPIILNETNAHELEEICHDFQAGKAPEYDNIPMYLIKYSFDLIYEPLAQLINLSLTTGVFPDKLKIAKVIPIYKAENRENFSNYRPISLLTNFSKIFERVMYKRLITFVEHYEILYCYQFGFRKNHSTSMALIHLVNKITSAIDCKEITAGVFLDLSKAFDTIDHDILFNKLEHYGISGMALTWIKSYFFERKQFVEFNQTSSSEQTIKCGVPQGSILGPLFFILYINDLPNASKVTEILIFADDTSIFYLHSDPKHLESVLNEELKK